MNHDPPPYGSERLFTSLRVTDLSGNTSEGLRIVERLGQSHDNQLETLADELLSIVNRQADLQYSRIAERQRKREEIRDDLVDWLRRAIGGESLTSPDDPDTPGMMASL